MKVVPKMEKAELTHDALGVFKDPTTGEYHVAHIKYDPLTGQTGEFMKVAAGPSRDFGIEKFKIMAGTLDIVG